MTYPARTAVRAPVASATLRGFGWTGNSTSARGASEGEAEKVTVGTLCRVSRTLLLLRACAPRRTSRGADAPEWRAWRRGGEAENGRGAGSGGGAAACGGGGSSLKTRCGQRSPRVARRAGRARSRTTRGTRVLSDAAAPNGRWRPSPGQWLPRGGVTSATRQATPRQQLPLALQCCGTRRWRR